MNLPIKKTKNVLNTKGFTIAELIISVGTLAILGVLILLFFMSSKDVGLRTKDLDNSVYHINNIVESIKSNSWSQEPLNNFELLSTSSEAASLTSVYDENWSYADEKEALFRTNITFKKRNEYKNKALYDVNIEVIRLENYFRSDEAYPVIHTIETILYIPNIDEELIL